MQQNDPLPYFGTQNGSLPKRPSMECESPCNSNQETRNSTRQSGNKDKRTPLHDSNRNSGNIFGHSPIKDQQRDLQIQFQPVFNGEQFAGQVWCREDELEEINGRKIKIHNNNSNINENQKTPKSAEKPKKVYSIDDEVEKIQDSDDDEVVIEGVRKNNHHINQRIQEKENNKPRVLYSDMKKEWWKDPEIEFHSHCLSVFNISAKADEEILYELFSKVGKIKRMKLFRISNRDIEDSHYLQSLNFRNSSWRPHKKTALIEYYTSYDVEAAIKVFDGLELYERMIYVIRYKQDHAKYQIHINRLQNTDTWLDAFFCIDYFTEVTNLIRVWTKYDKPNKMIKLIVHFPGHSDWERAKTAMEKGIKPYLNRKSQIFPFVSKYDDDIERVDYYGKTTKIFKHQNKDSAKRSGPSQISPYKEIGNKDCESSKRTGRHSPNEHNLEPGEI